MLIYKTISALQKHLQRLVNNGETIGFVPTMGALHAGHLSLISQARQVCSISVVSIFVNPTQFNDPKDFAKYPVTIEQDCLLLEQQHTDTLFLPTIEEMYPEGTAINRHFDIGPLETLWEGKYRPGHFQGVCQVVNRLLEIVQPHQLFLGRKDYQQCKVLERLIQITGIPTQLEIVPTMREPDGLAMSSRNVRLSTEQREKAIAIYRQLQWIKENAGNRQPKQLIEESTRALLDAGFAKIDYVAIADADTLEPLENIAGKRAMALIAAFMGEVRLIDNLLLTDS